MRFHKLLGTAGGCSYFHSQIFWLKLDEDISQSNFRQSDHCYSLRGWPSLFRTSPVIVNYATHTEKIHDGLLIVAPLQRRLWRPKLGLQSVPSVCQRREDSVTCVPANSQIGVSSASAPPTRRSTLTRNHILGPRPIQDYRTIAAKFGGRL